MRGLRSRGRAPGPAARGVPGARRPARERSPQRRAVLRPDEVVRDAGIPRRILGKYWAKDRRRVERCPCRSRAFGTAPPLVTLRNAPGACRSTAPSRRRAPATRRASSRPTRSPTGSATRSARSPSTPGTTRSTSTRTSSSASRTSRVSSSGASLHGYPFYNSEQSSQRYVKLKEPRAFVPPITGEALDGLRAGGPVGLGQLRGALGAAERRRLPDPEGAALRDPARERRAAEGRSRREAEKKAIETARYVIPIGRVHLDGAHDLGHHAAPAAPDGGRRRHAARSAAGHRRMVDLVREVDPFFFEKVGCEELPADELPEVAFPRPRRRRRVCRGVRPTARRPGVAAGGQLAGCAERSVAEAVRATFGLTAERACPTRRRSIAC